MTAPPHHHAVVITTLAALLLCCPAAHGQADAAERVGERTPMGRLRTPAVLPDRDELADVIIPDALIELAAELNDDSYPKRDAATANLRSGEYSIGHLCALLDRAALSHEARYRLLAEVRRRVTYTRGALGVSMSVWTRRPDALPGIVVRDLLVGFPARRVLQIGDRITHIAGEAVHFNDDVLVLVQTRQPGDIVTMTVQRPRTDGKGNQLRDDAGEPLFDELELKVELGAAEALADPSTGRQPLPSGLERRQRMEAEEASRRYLPLTRRISIHGAEQAGLAENDALRLAAQLREARTVIQLIQNELDFYNQSRFQMPAGQRLLWHDRLRIIDDLIRDPALPDAARQELVHLRGQVYEMLLDP